MVIIMSITEVREIKERISLETAKLKGKELQEYYAKRAKELQDKIETLREST